MHMMQLWMNLPRAQKMSEPGYQPIPAARIPTVGLPGDGGSVRVIAGEYAGRRGPARTFTPITMLDVTLRKGHELVLDVPADHNALAVVTSGAVAAGGERGKGGELVLFENDGGQLGLRAEADARVVILAGQPIDEPIVQYGPFVMNTEAEIDEAIADFNAGRFGRVPEDGEG